MGIVRARTVKFNVKIASFACKGAAVWASSSSACLGVGRLLLKRLGGGSLQASLGMHNPNPMKIQEFLLKFVLKYHQFGFPQRIL